MPLELIATSGMEGCTIAEYLNIDVPVFHPNCGRIQGNRVELHECIGI